MASVIVGLMGKKRSGKDTFAARLVEYHGFTRLAFADALKNALIDTDPMLDTIGFSSLRLSELVEIAGWERAKESPEVRRLLQNFGVAVRNHVGESSWVRAVHRQAVQIAGPVVVTDVRFPNEADWVLGQQGSLVRILRAGQVHDDDHESETAVDDYEASITIRAESGDVGRLHREASFLAGALGVRR